ncbi:hypothetical protein L6452_14181 [Arctium lappa]|uniref:Uncharacterized protein n=1 Tax=Arctium lappa TaxID=4217 RepID=A0ACB9CKB8_ARCLA|nr:hypothetical protein L6452_14181 [Arctium lappa]
MPKHSSTNYENPAYFVFPFPFSSPLTHRSAPFSFYPFSFSTIADESQGRRPPTADGGCSPDFPFLRKRSFSFNGGWRI